MKEIVTFTDTSRKYYGFDEHSLFLRKRLREVWDLIHLNPFRNWKWCIDNTNSGAAGRSDAPL